MTGPDTILEREDRRLALQLAEAPALDPAEIGPGMPQEAARRTQNMMGLHRRLALVIGRSRPLLYRAAREELDHGRLFLAAPLCIGLGSILWLEAATEPPLYRLLLWLALCGGGLAWLRPDHRLRRAVAAAGLLVALGALLAAAESWRRQTVLLDSPVTTTVTGEILTREGAGKGGWRYIIAVDATASPKIRRAPAFIALTARGPTAGLPVGTRISGRARLAPPAGPALPGLGDFAMRSYFAGIGATGFFYGNPASVSAKEKAARSWAATAAAGLASVRSDIGTRIRTLLPGDTGAFAASLVTDERRAISRGTSEALRLAGLSHIVAISGLNMALSAGIFFVGLRKLLSLSARLAHAYPIKKFAAFGALLALCAYYLICGFAVSAERAFLMMVVMLFAVFFDRPSLSLRNLAISALIILALSPSQILGPSFQMSFAATAGLVSSGNLFLRRFQARDAPSTGFLAAARRAILLFTLGIGVTSLIGGLSTALFAAAHFQRLTSYGLPANLMAMPIISFLVMPMGMLAMLLMPLGLDGPAWVLVGIGLDWVIAIAKLVAGWGGSLETGRLPAWYFICAVTGMLIFALLRTALRHFGSLAMLFSTALVLALPSPPPPDLVIAEDGETVGRPASSGIATNRNRPPTFLLEQWQHALRRSAALPPQPLPKPPDKAATARRKGKKDADLPVSPLEKTQFLAVIRQGEREVFLCLGSRWCVLRTEMERIIVWLGDPALLGTACDMADVVIAARHLKQTGCRSGATLFTRDTLRQSGAVELHFPPQGLPMVTASITSLDRPWNRHRLYDWRSDSFITDKDRSPPSDTSGSDE